MAGGNLTRLLQASLLRSEGRQASPRLLLSTTSVRRHLGQQQEMDISKDYYSILGVTPDATATEVREAFYDAARRLHPDVNPDPNARKEFEFAQEAFRVLKDPRARRRYDIAADVERSLEQKAEDLEMHWMTKRSVRMVYQQY